MLNTPWRKVAAFAVRRLPTPAHTVCPCPRPLPRRTRCVRGGFPSRAPTAGGAARFQRRFLSLPRSRDAVGVQSIDEGAARNTEELGGTRLIAATGFKGG